MDKEQIDQFRKALLLRREELQSASREQAQNDDSVELDQSRVGRVSRVDALQQHAMHTAAQRLRNAELASITGALQRIETDSYGWCTDCGDEIAVARLTFNPAAQWCIDCAEKREAK